MIAKIFKQFIIVMFLASVYSCVDLNEAKPGALSPENFLVNQDDALDLLNGAYSAQYSIESYLKPWIILNDIGSDDCGYLYAEFPQRTQYDRYIFNPDYTDFLSMWWHHYMIINRAGLVIQEVPNMTDGAFDSPEMKNRIMGEAKFLRAYNYFNLIRCFGDVPFFGNTYTTNPVGATEMERESVDVIYDFVIEELLEAKEMLWSKTETEKGRATRGAAQTLLAKVYLTRAGWRLDAKSGEMIEGESSNWSLAADMAKQVIDEQVYSLLDSFRMVFPAREEDYMYENNEEHIYFINATVEGPWFETKKYYGPRRFDNGGAYSSYVGEMELYEKFDTTDLRLDATYLMWVYDQDFQKRFDLNDPKVDWYWWPQLNIPHIGKFLPDEEYYEYPPQENLSGTNLIMFRYAEVLLMYAEAQNEADGNPNAQAIAAYNEIRTRAGLTLWPDAKNEKGEIYTNSQEGFRAAVRAERRTELAFEQKRLFDLKRWGNLVDVIKSIAERENANQEDMIRAQNITVNHNLFPIPYYEIQRNSKLNQNPGF